MTDLTGIASRYKALEPVLDERSRRLMAAESLAIGRGGISAVSKATGVMRSVIRQGIAELKEPGGDSDEAEQHSAGKSNKIPA